MEMASDKLPSIRVSQKMILENQKTCDLIGFASFFPRGFLFVFCWHLGFGFWLNSLRSYNYYTNDGDVEASRMQQLQIKCDF